MIHPARLNIFQRLLARAFPLTRIGQGLTAWQILVVLNVRRATVKRDDLEGAPYTHIEPEGFGK